MVPFLTHMLALYGVVFLVADAKVTQRPRVWLVRRSKFFDEMLDCWFCTGFWISLAAHMWFERATNELGHYVEDVVVGGFAGATFVYALNVLVLTLEASNDRST